MSGVRGNYLWLFVVVVLAGCGRSSSQLATSDNKTGPTTTSLHALPAGSIQSFPLKTTASTESTFFRRLPAAKTGVDFVHQWNPPRGRDREIANAMAGGGVAIGDYDDDGLPDLFLTRPHGGCRMYRNRGGFRFEDVTDSAGLQDESVWGLGATFGDLDNDGDLDLYICGFACPNRLYVNRGDGTFVERAKQAGLAYQGASIMLSLADYDLDGDLDAYLLTNRLSPPLPVQAKAVLRNGKWIVPEEVREYSDVLVKPDGTPFPIEAGQYDHLFRNDGLAADGLPRFTDVSREAGISGNHFGLSATWWDFDDDGLPDLYVSNDFHGPDRLYRNNGDGTFRDIAGLALPHTPWFSMGTDAADINNDGRLDFMASDMSGSNHFKQKVAMGDMAENSWFLTSPTPRQYMRNAVYLNTGTGRFMEVAYLTGLADTNWTWSLNFADFDNDSRCDLFVTNGMTRDWFHSDLRAESRRRGDWNEGGREFWMDQPKLRERNFAFRNQGDLQFEDVSKSWGLDYLGVSFGSAVGDLDGDGDLDIVVNNFEEPVGIYENQSGGGHRLILRLRGTRGNQNGIGATVRIETDDGPQVRQLWPAHGFMSNSQSVVHFGLGRCSTVRSTTIYWPSGHVQRFEDLEADQLYVVSEPANDPPPRAARAPDSTMFVRTDLIPLRSHRENEFNDFAKQPLLPNQLSRLGPGMAWGDVNGDGFDDLFVGGAAGQPGTLLIHKDNRFVPADEYFGPTWIDPLKADAECEDMGAVWLDAESDGDLDLYVASGGYEFDRDSPQLQDRLYINDGHGALTRSPSAIPKFLQSSSAVAAADYDHDGDLDLFVGSRVVPGEYPVTPPSQLLRNESANGEPRFVDATDDVAPGVRTTGLVTGALWSDVDQDSWPDLLVTHEWGPVKLFRNEQGRLVDTSDRTGLADRTGWWNSIAGSDLDHDGDTDYVVTNFGLNTKYTATRERPTRLYYGDFDGTGLRQLVEAEYEHDALYPIRGRGCSSQAMPALATRFPTFESFALASLTDIYDQSQLDKAIQLSANTLESGLLINDGTGHFEFQPLPRLAQASPSFGVALLDVDGDGTTDLFLAQNFFSPQPETGRMDGGVGLLLRGSITAKGYEMTPVMPATSGIVLAGSGSAVTTADLNGDAWPDLIAALNDGPLLAFQNRSSHNNHRSRAIRLRGKAGNPQAIGAIVTVECNDGTRMSSEVTSSSGYLSQSTSVVMFGLGSSRDVNKVLVRWPLGSVSEHEFPKESNHLAIDEP